MPKRRKNKAPAPSRSPKAEQSPISPLLPSDGKLQFSFRYCDLNHPKFNVLNTNPQYCAKLLERLHSACQMTKNEFCSSQHKAWRVHTIQWSDTTEQEGFSHLSEDLQGFVPWQFQISANEHGRVHGFIIAATFFVVWFDPQHQLYS